MDRDRAVGLTEGQRRLLVTGCKGPRPGSNAWPFVEYEYEGFDVPGEVVDKMIRDGLLAPSPSSLTTLTAGEDDVADFDIDCTHNYDATEAGRHALAADGAARAGGDGRAAGGGGEGAA